MYMNCGGCWGTIFTKRNYFNFFFLTIIIYEFYKYIYYMVNNVHKLDIVCCKI